MILDCHVVSQDYVIIWPCDLMGRKPLKVSHHCAKFCDHRYCGRGDVFLVCHVVSQDHVIIWLCDFMSTSSQCALGYQPLLNPPPPPPAKFCDHRHCGSRDMFLVSHVISRDNVIIWSCDFMGRSRSR